MVPVYCLGCRASGVLLGRACRRWGRTSRGRWRERRAEIAKQKPRTADDATGDVPSFMWAGHPLTALPLNLLTAETLLAINPKISRCGSPVAIFFIFIAPSTYTQVGKFVAQRWIIYKKNHVHDRQVEAKNR